MKKVSKRVLSILLAVLMIVSIVPVSMITAQAAQTTRTVDEAIAWASKKAANRESIYHSYNPESRGECIQFVCAYCDYIGLSSFYSGGGSANAYCNRAAMNGYTKVWGNYKKGDIIVWNYNDCHIGIFLNYNNDGSFCWIDSNFGYTHVCGSYNGSGWYPGVSSKICCGFRPNWKTTPPPVPAATTPKVSVDFADVAVGKNVKFSWSSSNAAKYEYILTGPNGKTFKTDNNCKSTSFAVTLPDVGVYSFKVRAFNKENKASSYSEIKKCTSHAKVKVQFVDWDGSALTNEQLIDWNSSVTAPASPSRKGYTFQGWDGSYSNIKKDRVITAQYKIITYTVRFFDKSGNVLKSEKVDYDNAATPPLNTNNPTGYNFLGWNSEVYKHAYTEAANKLIDIQGIYSWFNDDLPVVCEITSAKREDDGYYVTFDLTNYDKAITRGRAVVSLKTAEGKLVDTTESTAFSIPKDGTKKGIEVFVPCDNAATKAEVIIVDSYSSGVPISEAVNAVIDQGLSWSEWSTEVPDPNNEYLTTESRTEYRYKDKQFTTSTASNTMDGWTLYNTTTSWSDYGAWSGWSTTAYSGSSSRQVESRTTYRFHAFYCSKGCRDPYSSPCDAHRYSLTWAETWHPTPGVNIAKNTLSGVGDKYYCYINGTKWWYEKAGYSNSYNGTGQPSRKEYRYRDRKQVTTYHFYKWGDWSDWSADAVENTDNRNVETRTVYRYKDNAATSENNTGVVRTTSGQLDTSFAGKQITLYVYGYIGASDFTNYYIGQSVVGADGSYSFTYKLREEPSVKTGDFTIAIGIEGTSNTTVIGKIEAPKPVYTVNFYDWDGTIISTQQVTQGNDATLPEDPSREGYEFTGWDKSVTNVQEDLDVFSDFKKLEYEVIFVDWANQFIQVSKYEYGATLTPPSFTNVRGYTFEGWDQIKAGNTVVTGNMVLTAEYKINTYTVKFFDFNGNVIDTQNVEFGCEAKAPETVEESADGKQFAGWFNPEEYEFVADDLEIHPAYYFEETAEAPTANYDSGEYSDTIQLTLTSADSNAVIFYYLNGDQTNEKIYTKPITIDETCQVTYYATSLGKNDSVVTDKYYCINSSDKPSAWMLYSEIPQDVKTNISDYNLESETGYRFKDTTTTSLINEANALVENGWTYVGDSYSSYTSWSDAPISMDNTKIGFEIDTQEAPDTSVTRYQYSHYKYIDNGVVKYAPSAVADFDCEYETLIVDNRLSIAGFTDDNVTYYNHNGVQWFSQTKINGVKTQYRSRYKINTYYKWTAWGITAPDSNETRDYEQNDVYRYSNICYHLVRIREGVENEKSYLTTVFVKDGDKINLSMFKRPGYELEGLYFNKSFNDIFNAELPIINSVNLYPNYIAKSFTVTFQMVDGTEIDTQSVDYLCAAEAPATDAVPGYVFVGWDKTFDSITEDTVVIGRYVKESDYARVSLDKAELSMYQGNSIVLNATVAPENLADSELQWSSSDSSIATVDDKGIVTAVGYGEVTITVAVADTGETATCTISVHKDATNSLILNADSKLNYDALGYLRRVGLNTKTADLAKEFNNKTANLKFFDINANELGEGANVGTGTQIKLYNGDAVADTKTLVITGDLNGDGVINNRDAVFAARVVVKKQAASEAQEMAMDVNGDGKINNRDVAMIARYLVGKETINN